MSNEDIRNYEKNISKIIDERFKEQIKNKKK
jgi:hypothetical protein